MFPSINKLFKAQKLSFPNFWDSIVARRIPVLLDGSHCCSMDPIVTRQGGHCQSTPVHHVQTLTNLIIYTQTNDIVLNTKTFARPTIGPCKCLQQFDGHPVLLWNLGRGKMVDYPFLHSVIHQGITGSPIFSIFHSRSTYFSSLGIQSTLSI